MWKNSGAIRGWWAMFGLSLASLIATTISIRNGYGTIFYHLKSSIAIVVFFLISIFVYSVYPKERFLKDLEALPIILLIGLLARLLTLVGPLSVGQLNKNVFGFLLDFIVPLAWMGFMKKSSKWWKLLFWVSLVFLAITNSRGSLIGVAIAVLISIVVSIPLTLRNVIIYVWSLVGILLASPLIISSSTFQRLLSSTNLSQFNQMARIEMATATIQVIQAHPLFGVGFSNLQFYANVFSWLNLVSPNENYLNILVSVGWIGFIVYLATGLYIIMMVKKGGNTKFSETNWYFSGILYGIIAISIHSFVDDTFFQSEVLILFAILIGFAFRALEFYPENMKLE